MAGAAYLSAKAAYTAGAGLVQIYTVKENRTILQQLLPKQLFLCIQSMRKYSLQSLLEWADVVLSDAG